LTLIQLFRPKLIRKIHSSAFDFYNDDFHCARTPKKASHRGSKSSVVNNINNNNGGSIHLSKQLNDSHPDFFMEDELNLSDPTKSSWRHDLVPIPLITTGGGGPILGSVRSGPYLVRISKIFDDRDQGCQIFLGTKYQNGKNIPNYHKLYQMFIKYNKRP
jgi:hypothetical protein